MLNTPENRQSVIAAREIAKQFKCESAVRDFDAWLEANPMRRKTPFGMPRFLVNWLNKASTQQAVTSKVSYRPRATRDATCPHAPACPFPGNWQCQQRTVLEVARVRYR